MSREHTLRPWMTRILDRDGAVRGAGILVDAEHVLTCAHVVTAASDGLPGVAPKTAVDVDFADSILPRVPARVLGDGWCPIEQHRRDIAVLTLDQPQRERPAAIMRRWPVRDDAKVRALGFPGPEGYGIWAIATLIGRGGPHGEWMQMQAAGGAQIRPGFSGAAVIDEASGYLIGMTVGRQSRNLDVGVSWMIPAETMVTYLPGLGRCIEGPPALDPSFIGPDDREPGDPAAARELTDFVSDPTGTNVRIMVVGAESTPQSVAVRRAVRLSDRESGGPGRTRAAGEVPPVGSVDLALDATGRTAEDILRLIAARVGLDTADARHVLRSDVPPMTIVIDRFDAAADPAGLLKHVVEPLVQRDATRILLTFGHGQSPVLGDARSIVLSRSSRHSSQVSAEDLVAQILAIRAGLQSLVELHRSLDRRFTAVPELRRWRARTRKRLARLQTAVRHGDTADAARQLPVLERTVTEIDRILRQFPGRLADLRGELRTYRAKAVADGHAEDAELDRVHRLAYRSLHEQPYDLAAAGAAVDRYVAAVRNEPRRRP